MRTGGRKFSLVLVLLALQVAAWLRAMVDFRQEMMRQVKIIVEKHADGYVAYPLGLKGIVVGEGSSYEEALADVKSAIRFHIETFGAEVVPDDAPLLEAFVAEATIPA